jgi:tetratricopeptide (TPR) repeat protein
LLNIPGYDDPQANVKRLVMSKLSDESSGPWLIIIDNADDADVLFGNSQHGSHRDPLINFVPQSRNGSVIFTTRTRGVALKIAELSLISLGGLERVDAIGLLEERLLPEHRHQLTNTATVNTFLETLSFHALAVVQAIAFMSSNHVTLSEYVAIYKNNESDAVDLLSEQFEDDTRYRETNNAVATTWYISLEQIQQQDPNAAEYLFFMACVGSNDISTLMLPPACKKTEFIKALGTLQAYAFITERQRDTQDLQKASKAFDVHPLVHIVIRNWLKAKDQWIPRVAAALKRMVKITPYGELCTRDIWTKYLHHAVYVTNIPEVLEMEERAMLLERIGACERELGRYSAAERTYREAFKQRSRTLGENHPDSLRARGNIGLALGFQGKWTEAEKMHREVTTMMTEMLGENHPDTITSREYIALALLGRGKHTEAAELYREQLPSTIEMMGAKHHDTLSVMYNYGVTLRKMGQDAEASRMLQEALELCTEVLGEEDVLTLSCLSSWGTLLHQQGKFADAERVHREALRKRKNSLGSEHPDIVRSMVQLAMALEAQDEYTEAEQLLRDAYEAGKTIFGPKSPAVTFAINALALMLRGQGNYDEAEHLVREVLAIREESLGVDHAETAMSMVSLAKLVSVRLEYKVALPLYKRAYDTFMATLGPDHPTTKDCLEHVEDVEYYLTGIRKTRESSNSGPAESSLPAQSDGANTTEVALRPRKKWRARLQEMVKKS